jgi:hypothetical protein
MEKRMQIITANEKRNKWMYNVNLDARLLNAPPVDIARQRRLSLKDLVAELTQT